MGDRSLDPRSPLELPQRFVPLKEWIQITHVCRFWRETALRNPFFWSVVIDEGPTSDAKVERLLAVLTRARSTPLDVHIGDLDTISSTVLDMLGARCSTLRRLHVLKTSKASDLATFSNAAPLLESLCVVGSKLVELPTLFSGETPSLRHLTLGHFTRFSGNRFRNLWYLQLLDRRFEREDHVKDLLAFLADSPRMKELALRKCSIFDSAAPFFRTSAGTVNRTLPFLSKLAFSSCEPNLVAAILSYLGRSVAQRNLILTVNNDWNVLGAPESRLKNTLEDYGFLRDVTALSYTFDSDRGSLYVTTPTSSTRISIPFGRTYPVGYRWFQQANNFVSFEFLRELSITGVGHDTFVLGLRWRTLFAAVKWLNKLVLHVAPMLYVLESLCKVDPHSPHYPAPALEVLHIAPGAPKDLSIEALRAHIFRRRDDGFPLRELRITLNRKRLACAEDPVGRRGGMERETADEYVQLCLWSPRYCFRRLTAIAPLLM